MGDGQVVADGPAVPYFSEDLIEAFPDAKVILTERPVDSESPQPIKFRELACLTYYLPQTG